MSSATMKKLFQFLWWTTELLEAQRTESDGCKSSKTPPFHRFHNFQAEMKHKSADNMSDDSMDLLDEAKYRLLLEDISDVFGIQSTSTLSAPLTDTVEQQMLQYMGSLSKKKPRRKPMDSAPPTDLNSPAGPQLEDSVSRGHAGCAPLGAAPHSYEQPHSVTETLDAAQAAPNMDQGLQNIMQPGPLHGQPGANSQGQIRFKKNNAPLFEVPEGYRLCRQHTHTGQRKKKRGGEQDADGQYVKKPPNAFMLFIKEQRPNVTATLTREGAAAVHTIIGQMWKSLSTDEQAKYYEQAAEEKRLHEEQHPGWSASLNYGKKRTISTDRRKASRRTEASASTSTEVTHLAKKPRVTTDNFPHQPRRVTESLPSTSYTGVMEAAHPQGHWMESLPSTLYS